MSRAATPPVLRPQMRRVGLSATIEDVDRLGNWLGLGGDPATVEIIRGSKGVAPRIDVLVSEAEPPWTAHHVNYAPRDVYAAVEKAQTTLIFVNSRSQAEFAF